MSDEEVLRIPEHKRMVCDGETYQFNISPKNQFRKCKDRSFIFAYADFVQRMKRCLCLFDELVLYPEYTPTRDMGNRKKEKFFPVLHFHGYAKLRVKPFYLYGVERLLDIGVFKVGAPADIQRCVAYSTKNESVMLQFLADYNLPYKFNLDWFKKKKIKKIMKTWYDAYKRQSKGDFDISQLHTDLDQGLGLIAN